jgi:hypothetical protein
MSPAESHVPIAHTYNPSYWGGYNQEDLGSRSASDKKIREISISTEKS